MKTAPFFQLVRETVDESRWVESIISELVEKLPRLNSQKVKLICDALRDVKEALRELESELE